MARRAGRATWPAPITYTTPDPVRERALSSTTQILTSCATSMSGAGSHFATLGGELVGFVHTVAADLPRRRPSVQRAAGWFATANSGSSPSEGDGFHPP